MVDTQIQTRVHKVSSEFVDRGADIITKLCVQMDKCCPDCRELIKGILKLNKKKVLGMASSNVSKNALSFKGLPKIRTYVNDI